MAQRIKVHEKALAHLSKGLYRSPASALRELVSNAWDAGATRVEISTFAPTFTRLVVRDNGAGFDKQDFVKLMETGIGNSTKRLADGSNHGRPIIGRLGIGLLGVAQICTRFQIISRRNNGEIFAAEVRIEDFLRRRLDIQDPTIVPQHSGNEVFIGEWDFIPVPKIDNDWVGTQVIVTTPLASFSESFIKTLRPTREGRDTQEEEMGARVDDEALPSRDDVLAAMPPLDWQRLLDLAADKESVMMRGDYWRFLWELAATCPLPYMSAKAVPDGLVRGDQKRLEGYQFALIVDNRELRKPVFLPPRDKGYSTQAFSRDIVVEGRQLKFHGYMAVQEGNQLKPAELRGLMIRIKEVGVGYYDPTLLDWQVNQGPRSRWITGEIFVEEGLEDAMNVDRDSFNRYHPEFKALQREVHRELKKLFSQVYLRIGERSTKSADERSQQRREVLLEVAKGTADGPVKLIVERKAESNETQPQFAKQLANYWALDVSSASTLPTKKVNRDLAASVLAIYDLCMLRYKHSKVRREKFQEALLELLREW